jgi:NADH-quinone oxidoreductase subunit M
VSGAPLLTLITFGPLVGALMIMLFARGDEKASNARWVALWASSFVFLVSLLVWAQFDPTNPGFQMKETYEWFPEFNIAFRLGVDGISIYFILLSTFLTPICILASWTSVDKRVSEYMAAFLALETFMVGMFCALDMIAFYVFFEGVLIPMFLIIGVWGGARRIYASFKFFLYTLLGSVLMLVAIIAMIVQVGGSSIEEAMLFDFDPELQIWLWLAFFASFSVKMPMWPVHTWLPDAHVEAPTAGSVILAGVLLKMGGYGFLRFSLPMFPDASAYFSDMVYALSIVAIVYTSLVALAQEDMKKLIAYSSVAHMGYVTLGIFTGNAQGVEGAVFQMLSHGIVSAALFLCVGVVYDRMHTREISRYGGLVHRMPKYAAVMMIFTMASVGLPGTSGFIGEFLVLAGAFLANTWVAALAATGLILGAAYMLMLYRRVIFGKLEHDDLKSISDLTWREAAIFTPLVILVLWMGIYPASFLDGIQPAVAEVLSRAPVSTASSLQDIGDQARSLLASLR